MPAFVNTFFEERVQQLFKETDPDAGRLTKDVDIAATAFGLEHRHVAGVGMLVQSGQPSARRAVHLVFAGEMVPAFGRMRGLRLIPLADLSRMRLTSFRASDEAHLKDLDEAGLITAEIEAGLSPLLAERLARLRARA